MYTQSLNLFNLFLVWASGGRQGKMPVTAFEAFDLEMKSWTRYPCIPSRRAFSSCAATERAFYSIGGLQQPGPHNFYSRPHFVSTVEEYDSEQGEFWSLPHIYMQTCTVSAQWQGRAQSCLWSSFLPTMRTYI